MLGTGHSFKKIDNSLYGCKDHPAVNYRFVVNGETLYGMVIPGSAKVFRFDTEYGLDLDLVAIQQNKNSFGRITGILKHLARLIKRALFTNNFRLNK